MNNLIFDFETMGQDPSNCAVVDVSVMTFDWDRMLSDNPYTVSDINLTTRFKISVVDQAKNYGFKVENDVIDFWSKQSKEVRSNVAPKKDDLTVADFTNQFHSFLIDSAPIAHWWSRSNTFDPVILQRLFDSQDKGKHLGEYLKYYLIRDTRTWIDAKLNFPKKNGFVLDEWKAVFAAHDSRWDILIDVLRMQLIARTEADLPI